jgi:hypothetical protein
VADTIIVPEESEIHYVSSNTLFIHVLEQFSNFLYFYNVKSEIEQSLSPLKHIMNLYAKFTCFVISP